MVKVDRAATNLGFTATHAGNRAVGLAPLSSQLAGIPARVGTPVVAVNGDFYRTSRENFPGDPRGVQIIQSEMLSGPADTATFWIDAKNEPKMAVVRSRFRAIWPDGKSVMFGLNEERSGGEAVLYTPRIGASIPSSGGGRELILEPSGEGPALPLQAGQTYLLRVREVRNSGSTRLGTNTVVLSLDSGLARSMPLTEVGVILKISTSTSPEMSGAQTAVGGGPILIQDGKIQNVNVSKSNERHPRTAFGWNERSYFFVEVDGRQGHSDGMALPELSAYMLKLGCTHAMNLDGGASATIWANGQVLNSPSSGRERDISNCLVVVRKPAPAAERQP
jgi:hypothetical protein